MTAGSDVEAAARRYADYFERLTPESLAELDELCAPEVRFRDPFNDVTGVKAFAAVLEKMFEEVAEPRFRVDDVAVGSAAAYLRWCFTFKPRGGGKAVEIEGMTELRFDERGLVTAHLDHWDSGSQFYERLPVVGALIRLVKRRIAAGRPGRSRSDL